MLNQIPGTISYARIEESEEYGNKELISDQLVFTKYGLNFNDIKYGVADIETLHPVGYIKKLQKNEFGQEWFFYSSEKSTETLLAAYTLKNLKAMISELLFDI